jgi:hypothetical protein
MQPLFVSFKLKSVKFYVKHDSLVSKKINSRNVKTSNSLLCNVGSVLVILCYLSTFNYNVTQKNLLKYHKYSLKYLPLNAQWMISIINDNMNAFVFNSSATQCGLANWYNWLVLLPSASLYYISGMLTNDKLHLCLLDKIPGICCCLVPIITLL